MLVSLPQYVFRAPDLAATVSQVFLPVVGIFWILIIITFVHYNSCSQTSDPEIYLCFWCWKLKVCNILKKKLKKMRMLCHVFFFFAVGMRLPLVWPTSSICLLSIYTGFIPTASAIWQKPCTYICRSVSIRAVRWQPR